MTTDNELIALALHMRANYVETRDTSLSREDVLERLAVQTREPFSLCGWGEKVKAPPPLSEEQHALVARLRALARDHEQRDRRSERKGGLTIGLHSHIPLIGKPQLRGGLYVGYASVEVPALPVRHALAFPACHAAPDAPPVPVRYVSCAMDGIVVAIVPLAATLTVTAKLTPRFAAGALVFEVLK